VRDPDPDALAAVVLAAGRGRRISELAPDLPKPLMPVLGRPLLAWQLDALEAAGVRRVVLVLGHLRAEIERFLAVHARGGLALATVEQREPLGIAHALEQAEPHLDRPFLCLLGDMAFDAADLPRLAAALEPGVDAVLGVRDERDPREIARNYAVEIDAAGDVRSVVEKPTDGRIGWKGVGLYAFTPGVFAAVHATPPSALRGERELTDAIQRHVAGGARVRAVALTAPDFNLSEPADLLDANLWALDALGAPSWIAPGARVDTGAELERVVVLEGARVRAGVRAERVLVFPGEELAPGTYRDVGWARGRAFAASSGAPGRR
jgi:glucose-1-phosphate thymidylyltransferase